MSWRNEWNGISARILSLSSATQLFASMIGTSASGRNSANAEQDLVYNADETFNRILQFWLTYESTIPPAASDCLKRFETSYRSRFLADPAKRAMLSVSPYDQLLGRITTISSFHAEFCHLASDNDFLASSLVERAFLHLQYSIVANSMVSDLWRSAFAKSEVACEQLGATHLLLHGIWAFKANGLGERTDLVLGTRLHVTAQLESAVEAMALTEWKIVRDPDELAVKANAAFKQARLYGKGSLAGFELSSRRYLVLVSADRLEMPPGQVEDGVQYQFQNISVTPSSPSVASKR